MRLSRSEFRTIQVELEARVLREQPELEQALAIGKRSDRRRAGKEDVPAQHTARSTVLERARYAAEQATGEQALHTALKAEGLDVTRVKDVTRIPHNGCRPSKRRRM